MTDKYTSLSITPQFDPEDLADVPDGGPITPAEIMAEVKAAHQTGFNKFGLFVVRTANQCIEDAKSRPIPKTLFGDFWFEGELCILFAGANLGKSILAVQIGDSISNGKSIPGFTMEAQAQKVLYFDFELSDKQFEARYSENFKDHYFFNPNFHRAEIDLDADVPDGYDEEVYLIESLERTIKETGAKVLILDNLTYLKNETEKARNALPLMKHLKALKGRYGLSILALAHTPKRDLSKPLTRNDLQGSTMLINFCDSSFAIGESNMDKHIRYTKQIKARNTEIIYDTENVVLWQIQKAANFLQFVFEGYAQERQHLRVMTEQDHSNIDERINEMKAKGLSNVEIGRQIGVSEGAIRKRLSKMQTP